MNEVQKTQSNIPLAFFPFTPVPFTGKNALWAYTRLGAYSLIAIAAFKKFKPLSYAAMGAAGVSLLTSLSGQAFNNGENKAPEIEGKKTFSFDPTKPNPEQDYTQRSVPSDSKIVWDRDTRFYGIKNNGKY